MDFSGQLYPRARNVKPRIGNRVAFRTGLVAEKRPVFEAAFVGCPARSLLAIWIVVFRPLTHLTFCLNWSGCDSIVIRDVLLKKRSKVIITTKFYAEHPVVLYRIIRDSITPSQLLYIINNFFKATCFGQH